MLYPLALALVEALCEIHLTPDWKAVQVLCVQEASMPLKCCLHQVAWEGRRGPEHSPGTKLHLPHRLLLVLHAIQCLEPSP